MYPDLALNAAIAMMTIAVAFGALLRQTAAVHQSAVTPDIGKGGIVNTKRLFAAAVLVGLVGAAALAQSSDPLVGTWKLNVAKSTGTSFKSGTTKIEAAGAGVKFTVDLVGTDGTAYHWAFTANYDGKDNPVTGKSPYGDTTALERVDAKTTRIISKRGGKVVTTQTIVVSADGKTRTTTTKGTDAKGQTVDTISFYEKQ